MLELRRTVRFAVNPVPEAGDPAGKNGFGGFPRMRGLGRYYEVDAVCHGEPDPVTGYLISIKHIDDAVRMGGVPVIARACGEDAAQDPMGLLPALLRGVGAHLDGLLTSIRWRLTPTYSVEMAVSDTQTCMLRQQFDFAAAHRLHVPGLSDEENRAVFGRCNNPSGHGHNYRIEPAVAVPAPGPGEAPVFALADLERVTAEAVIDRFDHTHLNEDTPEFASGTGVNPSVENIARVFFERLSAAIAERTDSRARLVSITVWETDRTSCTYPEAGR